MERVELSPYALTSEDRAISFIRRNQAAEEGLEDWVPIAINAASQQFERWTGRRLAARTYRSPVTIACTTSADDTTLQGTGFLTKVKELDLISGSALAVRPGTRVQSITSDVALEMTKTAASSVAGTNITFGSQALRVRGDGTAVLYIPETPVIELFAVTDLGWDGLSTPADLTNLELEKETGRLELALGGFDLKARIQIEASAGYRAGTFGDTEASQLEWACLRLVECMWQDFISAAGRTGSVELAQATQQVTTFAMPSDVRDALAPYRRVG